MSETWRTALFPSQLCHTTARPLVVANDEKSTRALPAWSGPCFATLYLASWAGVSRARTSTPLVASSMVPETLAPRNGFVPGGLVGGGDVGGADDGGAVDADDVGVGVAGGVDVGVGVVPAGVSVAPGLDDPDPLADGDGESDPGEGRGARPGSRERADAEHDHRQQQQDHQRSSEHERQTAAGSFGPNGPRAPGDRRTACFGTCAQRARWRTTSTSHRRRVYVSADRRSVDARACSRFQIEHLFYNVPWLRVRVSVDRTSRTTNGIVDLEIPQGPRQAERHGVVPPESAPAAVRRLRRVVRYRGRWTSTPVIPPQGLSSDRWHGDAQGTGRLGGRSGEVRHRLLELPSSPNTGFSLLACQSPSPAGSSRYLERKRSKWREQAELLEGFRDVTCADCRRRYAACAMDFDHRDAHTRARE